MLTQEREALLRKREKRASMAISFIMILLGLSVVIAAADDLAGGPESESEMNLVLGLSFVSIVVFGGITIVKFRFASKLDSISMYKDGVCSLIGTVLACGVFTTTLSLNKLLQCGDWTRSLPLPVASWRCSLVHKESTTLRSCKEYQSLRFLGGFCLQAMIMRLRSWANVGILLR